MKYFKKFFLNYRYLALILALILLLVLLLDKNHWKESKYDFNQVYPVAGVVDKIPTGNIIDYSSKSYEICTRGGCELNFDLKKQKIDKIFLSFNYGEAPDGVKISGQNGDQITLLDSFDRSNNIENLSKFNSRFHYNEHSLGVRPYYTSYISGNFDSIKIEILPTKEDRTISINDVFFYQSKVANTSQFIYNLLVIHQRSAISYIFYAIVFLMTIFSVGFFAIDKFFKNVFGKLESVFIAFGISLVFWAVLGLVTTMMPTKIGLTISTSSVVLSLIYFFRSEFLSEIKLHSRMLLLSIVFILFVLLYLFIFDGGLRDNSLYYKNDVYFDGKQTYDLHPDGYGSDQMTPYGSGKILLYNLQKGTKEYSDLVGINVLSSRTQLFTYFTLPFLRVFADRFLIFEILGVILISLLPASVWLLAMEMTKNKRVGYLAVFFAFTSPYLIYLFNITQLKIISTVLLTAYFYFLYKYKKDQQKQSIICASFFAAIAILVHDFSLIYVIAGIIFLSPNIFRWFKRKKIVDLLIVLAPVFVAIVWFVYSYLDSKSNLVTSVTGVVNNPIGIEYFRQKFGQRFNDLSPYFYRYLNFLGFFSTDPAPAIAYRSEGFFRSTIYSLTSFVLLPFFVWSVIKFFKKYAAIWLYLGVLLVLTLCSVGEYTYAFGMQLYMVVAIPLLLVLAAEVINSLSLKYIIFISFLVLAESIFLNFIVYKNLADLQIFMSQFPLYAFLIYLIFILLQFVPLYYFLQEAE